MTSTQGGDLVDLASIRAAITAIDAIIDNIHDTDLPAVKTVLDNLHNTDIPALLVEVEYIEHHFHGGNRAYGKSAATGLMVQDSTTPLTVEGGDNAYGTEALLHKGSLAGSYFDTGKIQVSSVDAANQPTILQFYAGTLGAGVACTGEADDDIVTAAGHGCVDGDLVIFDTLDSEANGVNKSTVYYVRNMSGNTFKVALISGGGAINITGDVAGTIKKISTPTWQTELIVAMAAINNDATPIGVSCPKIPSTSALWCRAKSPTGQTVLISFFLDIHTYV